MKKALISRFCAYGDILHASFLPRLLKDQGYDVVDFEMNFKAYQLMCYNPFIDNIIFYEPTEQFPMYLMEKHWQVLSQGYDKFVNLYKSLEYGCLAMEDENVYYQSDTVRRNRYGNINFYDKTCLDAGYPELCGRYLGEVFYPQFEIDLVEHWMKEFKDKFTVMINLCGTGGHKEFHQAQEFVDRVRKEYKDVVFITTGGKEYEEYDLKGDDIVSIVGKKPFVQALLIAKYVDCLISCESGIAVGANMWGTPTIQLMTAANLMNHQKYAINDFSIQSPAYCSPCHKGCYSYIGCPSKEGRPLCVYFDMEIIMEKFKEVYALKKNGYNRVYA